MKKTFYFSLFISVLSTFICFLLFEPFYFYFIAQNIWEKQLNDICHSSQELSSRIQWKYAPFAYLLMSLIIVYFVVVPYLTRNEKLSFCNVLHIFINSAFLGFCVYGIYNFTNACILPNYHFITIFTDTLWGTILFGLTGIITCIITKLFYDWQKSKLK